MTWKQFVSRWRPVDLTRLGVPNRTVYQWRAGTSEPPKGWQRDAAEFFIAAKLSEKPGESTDAAVPGKAETGGKRTPKV